MPVWVNPTNIVTSIVVGFIIGLFVGIILKLPKTWKGYAIVLVLNIMSPHIGIDTRAFADETNALLVGNYFLIGFFAALNISFLMRWTVKKLRRHPVST
ncbi:MAG: hypothetical protein GXO93_05140 [FCB group bacterium]|nr:hypothetical protein [FCB group bacterium]